MEMEEMVEQLVGALLGPVALVLLILNKAIIQARGEVGRKQACSQRHHLGPQVVRAQFRLQYMLQTLVLEDHYHRQEDHAAPDFSPFQRHPCPQLLQVRP